MLPPGGDVRSNNAPMPLFVTRGDPGAGTLCSQVRYHVSLNKNKNLGALASRELNVSRKALLTLIREHLGPLKFLLLQYYDS